MTSKTSTLLVLLALAGCASAPTTNSPGPGDTSGPVSAPVAAAPPAPAASAPVPPPAEPTAAEKRTATASLLAVERQWLSSWFKGTPVAIAQRANGAVNVDVPREFCFDAGKDAIKPALAAVLDKVSQSMRRVPGAEIHLVAAPGDGATGPAGAALGAKRAGRVYDFLRSHGVPEARLVKPIATNAPAVQLRIEPAALPPASPA